ncbi:Ger(x)C family spore germination protein [Paenibacillus roseipurpureus]|uniref:Ger(X)C family spore germination protein n=1 Tax=Paenibacillus roseopurpureus TaxID=2918901 RepID=A0AA96RHX7_9BACL|nr:Ger(x)C family spore germination protein [Paenibacillus sp. MBLB1832]WNR43713.1 Ger(x)C family spore germination protein [Paenibacillus sp. MBLB1832]
MSPTLKRCLLLLTTCLLLTGCWDRKELNQLAITSATAIDWDGKVWTVSYQVVIPQSITNTGGNSGQQAPVMVFSTSGGTIRGTVQKSSLEMPRSLFFAHNRIVIIGEKAAEHGISQLLDVYLRNPDSRETVNLLVTGGEGRKILEQIIPLEKVPGSAIQNMIRNEDNNGSNNKQVKLYQLMMGSSSDAPYTLIPEIIISGEGDNNTIASLKNTSFPNKLKLGRTAIFKKDKLVGWFTKDEEYGNNWITNQIKKTTLYFGCSKESTEYRMAIRFDHAKTKLKPIFSDHGPLMMQVHVKAIGNIVENACPTDPTQPKDIQAIEQAAGAEIIRIMGNSFQAAIKKKVDIFHLADLIHKHDPTRWRQLKPDWDQQFANLQMDPQVDVKIARIGMSGKAYREIIKGGEE